MDSPRASAVVSPTPCVPVAVVSVPRGGTCSPVFSEPAVLASDRGPRRTHHTREPVSRLRARHVLCIAPSLPTSPAHSLGNDSSLLGFQPAGFLLILLLFLTKRVNSKIVTGLPPRLCYKFKNSHLPGSLLPFNRGQQPLIDSLEGR